LSANDRCPSLILLDNINIQTAMKILLTGAAGFLGTACADVLQNDGHNVVTTDRVGKVDFCGDLADPVFVRRLPRVDSVVHTAAVQYVSRDLPLLARHRYFYKNNVDSARALCAHYNGAVAHFVNIGTSMMYLQCGADSYCPTSPMHGQGIYSTTKLAAQRLIEASFQQWSTVVPCIIGGAGREGLFRRFVESIQRDRFAMFPGPGTHPTHMVHVHDVAKLVGIVVKEAAAGFYNAGAPEPLSIMQWIQEISAHLGISAVRIRHLPLKPIHALAAATGYRLLASEQLLMLGQPHVLDTSRSIALGWKPQRTNAQIVRELADYIVSAPASIV
jgi:nucleoside-diphosphate-sugar epimerase